MAELENAGNPSPEDILKQILSQVRPLFEGPLPNELKDSVPDLPPLFLYKLADREVTVQQEECAAGHIHRAVSLVETFRQAAGYGRPETSLDEALDQVEQKAAETPEGGVELAERIAQGGFAYDPESGDIKRVFSIQDTFETEASLSAPKTPQGIIFLGPDDLDELLGKDSNGPSDDDSGPTPPSGPDFKPA